MVRRIAGGLVVLTCFCGLVGLGLWQLQRLQWKEDILARLAEGTSSPATIWSDGDKSPEYTHVRLTGGHLQPIPELELFGRTYDGAAGVHVIALYVTGAGRNVIVDRGFLPAPVDPSRLTLASSGAIDGIVRAPSDKAWFEFKNNPAENEWYWMDLPTMGAAMGSDNVAPIYVEALTPTAATNAPIPTADRLASNLPNNHLQYAITWFALASALLIMYAIHLVRSTKQAAKHRKMAADRMYGPMRKLRGLHMPHPHMPHMPHMPHLPHIPHPHLPHPHLPHKKRPPKK